MISSRIFFKSPKKPNFYSCYYFCSWKRNLLTTVSTCYKWFQLTGHTFQQNPWQPAAAETRHRGSRHGCYWWYLWHFQPWPSGQIWSEEILLLPFAQFLFSCSHASVLYNALSELFCCCVLLGGVGPVVGWRRQLPDWVWETAGKRPGYQNPISHCSV